MHVIKAHEPSVTLFSVDGEVRIFTSMRDALRQLGYRWISENVRADFVVFLHTERVHTTYDSWVGEPVYARSRYVMRDDTGAKLTASDFSEARRSRQYAWALRYRSQLERWNGVGPVPYVHRYSTRSYYRRPQTVHERKLAQVMDDEPAPRCCRASGLPTDWHDRRVASREDRNWKKFRRTQWKPNN